MKLREYSCEFSTKPIDTNNFELTERDIGLHSKCLFWHASGGGVANFNPSSIAANNYHLKNDSKTLKMTSLSMGNACFIFYPPLSPFLPHLSAHAIAITFYATTLLAARPWYVDDVS